MAVTIGYKIKKLREAKKLSQPHLAEILGVSQSDLSKIENDQIKKIDFLFMDKVCKEFDVDFSYFTDSHQINNIKKITGCVNNHGTINITPESIVEYIKNVFEENKSLKNEIADLKNKK